MTTGTIPGVSPTGEITGTTNTLPWAPIPASYKAILTQMANTNELGGVPPQLLSYIMQAESGPSYEGGGWNGIAGGWFGLEAPDIAGGQATIVSQSTFQQQAQAAAKIYAVGLQKSGGNAVQAENYYQTGKLDSAANGAGIFTTYLQAAGSDILSTTLSPAQTIVGDIGTATGTTTTGATSWLTELGNLLGDLTKAEWWERVGLFAGGAVLVVVGIAVFISTTKTGQKVESDAAVAALA